MTNPSTRLEFVFADEVEAKWLVESINSGLVALRADRDYWRREAERSRLTAETYTGASRNKTDWCPCCKQDWNAGKDEHTHRLRIRELEAAQARQLATITELQAKLDNYSRAFATITPPGETNAY